MKKCKCGCTRFYAHQVCRVDVIVDKDNNFQGDITEGQVSVYDAEEPYGPYTCMKCGAEYDSLEELPDVPEYSVSETLAGKAFDLVRLCERMNGIKILMSAPGAITGLLAENKARKEEIDAELEDSGIRGMFSVKEFQSANETFWLYELLKNMDSYVTYEENIDGYVYSIEDMNILYEEQVDKTEYPDFDCWLSDMLRTGIFIQN